jgi:hypothetical protein
VEVSRQTQALNAVSREMSPQYPLRGKLRGAQSQSGRCYEEKVSYPCREWKANTKPVASLLRRLNQEPKAKLQGTRNISATPH